MEQRSPVRVQPKNGDTLKQQKQIAKKSFFTNCDIKSCNTVITPTYENDGSTVRVTAKYPVDTSFLGILGVGSLMANATAEVGVDGGSSTPSATGEYTEIHILIDNTGSMNIPASAAGITQIEALYNPYLKHDPTTVGCAFACHLASDDVGYDVTVGGKTGAVIARENGILMREDVVFTEAEGLVDYFQNHAGAHLFRIGAYAFTWGIDSRKDLTDDFAALKSYISGLKNESAGTQIDFLLDNHDWEFGWAGDGTSFASPHKTVILITDGVNISPSTGEPEAIDPSKCQTLKNRGINLIVLNLKYPDPALIKNRGGGRREQVAAIYGDIQKSLKQCATPGQYFEADWKDSIAKAFDDITVAVETVSNVLPVANTGIYLKK